MQSLFTSYSSTTVYVEGGVVLSQSHLTENTTLVIYTKKTEIFRIIFFSTRLRRDNHSIPLAEPESSSSKYMILGEKNEETFKNTRWSFERVIRTT